MLSRWVGGFMVSLLAVGAIAFGLTRPAASHGLKVLPGEVPLSVRDGRALYVRPHPANARLKVNFAYPLADRAGLDALIASHRTLSRAQLYARFAPPRAQVASLAAWLRSHGFTVTHAGADRMALTATATTAHVERALHVRINDYVRQGYTWHGVKVAPYAFYANTANPRVPAGLGLQTISGLTSVDRFFTSAQLNNAPPLFSPVVRQAREGGSVRSGTGYFPGDLRSLYDVAGHGFDGTGQTLGFTLWGAGERQAAMTKYANDSGDTPITVDPDCVATGNDPTHPSGCSTLHVAGDHLVTVLENGNTANANDQYDSNVETALDIEQAHGIATHAGMKYYDADCSDAVAPGNSDSGNCNGSDVGLEDAVEDAASDPTLHSVSNSWGYGGDVEWGLDDPFLKTVQNSFALAAAAGTTFYFSTGDSGTYFSGFPADSQYVVAVGGTTLFSTTDPTKLSTEETWAAGGSWCSNVIARPSWQDIPAVNGSAGCPGRAIPDISAVADTNSPVYVVATANNEGGLLAGRVGGTSVAAPELNGLQAVTDDFLAAQSYPGGRSPSPGFAAPVLYALGSGGHSASYFRDVQCGNTANPSSGPDGDAAQPGWDPATGWGAPDWLHLATGWALSLGATNLSVPSSLATSFNWSCAKTPTNASERAVAFPSSSVGYAAGGASGSTPWYAKMLAPGSWGPVNTFLKTADGGKTWFPVNSDMLSIACPSASACVEVGDGGRVRTTADGGATWTDAVSGFNKGLTSVQCPSASVCYAAGDRGFVLKSTDGGRSWAYLHSTASNAIYGLSCPSVSTCYASDIYAHIVKTSDGGATWTWQRTPVTTPGVDVPGSGGPNPFAGLFAISCVSDSTCVAVGGFPPAGTDPPIVATNDGGATWTLETSNAGTGDYLHGVACVPGSTTCYAVGRGGAIVTTHDLANWAPMTSGTTNALNGVSCASASSCVATGQGGTIDVLSGGTWTASSGNGGGNFLAGVSCVSSTVCFAAGKQGVTLSTTDGSHWAWQAGGGTTQQVNGMACPSASDCYAVGNNGTILATHDAGLTWLPAASGTTSALNGVACTSVTACVAVGAGGVALRTADGVSWTAGSGAGTSGLSGVSCSGGSCTAVGAGGTIVSSSDGGATWSAQSSGVSAALSAVSCAGGACYAVGGLVNGSAVALRGVGGSWTAEKSGAPQALSAVNCLDALQCFAGGAIGTVVTTTDGGVTWTQQGDPISGAVSALNSGPTGITQVNAAACNAGRCAFGTASSGDIMTSPLLVVTVHATTPYGSPPSFTLPASSAAISVSPSSEAANLIGTLTCTVDATDHSVAGAYRLTGCNGLSDPGFSVVYDYASSADTVVWPSGTLPVTGTVPATLALSLGAPASFGAFTPGVAQDYLASTTATVTSTAGDASLSVSDPDTVAPGHLTNRISCGADETQPAEQPGACGSKGTFVMPQPLQVAAGGLLAYNPLGASPLALLTWNGPVSSAVVTLGFKQSIGAHDALRTGTYSKTLTFTLSTTNP